MTSLIGVLIAGIGTVLLAGPKVTTKFKELTGGNVEPHDAVATLVKYFKSMNDADGVKIAKECGKRIYDAMGNNNEQK